MGDARSVGLSVSQCKSWPFVSSTVSQRVFIGHLRLFDSCSCAVRSMGTPIQQEIRCVSPSRTRKINLWLEEKIEVDFEHYENGDSHTCEEKHTRGDEEVCSRSVIPNADDRQRYSDRRRQRDRRNIVTGLFLFDLNKASPVAFVCSNNETCWRTTTTHLSRSRNQGPESMSHCRAKYSIRSQQFSCFRRSNFCVLAAGLPSLIALICDCHEHTYRKPGSRFERQSSSQLRPDKIGPCDNGLQSEIQ